MSRLLFAAARGARLQMQYDDWWDSELHVVLGNPHITSRVHPDDAHLEYGPISTALQRMAKTSKARSFVIPTLPPHLSFGVGHESYEEAYALMESDELAHSLFLLILAEALADEGL